MTRWKLPPKEKIYEAFSVLADKRFEIRKDGQATVTSSAGDKNYLINWSFDDIQQIRISSNDNASRWQGYTGYPIIAILMIINVIKYDKNIIQYFQTIPWKMLNKEHKNNYSEVVEFVLKEIQDDSAVEIIRTEVDSIFEQLSKLDLIKP